MKIGESHPTLRKPIQAGSLYLTAKGAYVGKAEIIGNDRPIAIPPPPPPKRSDIEIMAVAAVSITIQVGATVGLSVLGVPVPVSAAAFTRNGGSTSW